MYATHMLEKLLQILLYHILPAALLIYLGVGFILWWNQREYIFIPSERSFADCPEFADAEQIEHNGTRAYYKNNGGPLVVFYHGNAERACDRHFLARAIESTHGYPYLFVEYTGYAGDGKRPSADTLRSDAEHMVEFIHTKAHDPVILMSESIGSGAAAHHASLQRPDGIVLFAPMYSLERTAKYHYPYYPVSLLLSERLPVAKLLAPLDTEVHIIHGEEDELVPMAHAQQFFAELQTEQKTFTTVPQAGHNDLYSDPATFDAMHKALRSIHE